MNRKYSIIAALTVLTTLANRSFAQMNNVVEVENSFTPAIKDANKINVMPHIAETKVQHNSVEYSTNKQITLKTDEGKVDLENGTEQEKMFRNGYVSIGGGNEGNLKATGLFRMSLTPKDILNAGINFGGYKSKVENSILTSDDWESRYYKTTGEIGYEHKLTDNSALFIKADLESDVFNYQFTTPKMGSDKQHNWKGNISATLSPYSFNKFYVGGNISFNHFSQKYSCNIPDKLSENVFGADIILGYKFNDQATIKLEVDNEFCNSNFATLPKLAFGYEVNNNLYLYAKASTGKILQTLDRLTGCTPYFMLDSIQQQSQTQSNNISAKIGARIKTANMGTLNISACYETQKDKAEFSNIGSVDFVDSKHIEANIGFSGKIAEKFYLDIKNQWNNWTTSGDDENYKITWRPVVNLDWNVSYDITPKLNAGLGFLFQTFDKDDLYYERPTTKDLSASVAYTIKKGFNVYVEGNNLLNSKHDIFCGHKAPGINGIAGIRCTF